VECFSSWKPDNIFLPFSPELAPEIFQTLSRTYGLRAEELLSAGEELFVFRTGKTVLKIGFPSYAKNSGKREIDLPTNVIPLKILFRGNELLLEGRIQKLIPENEQHIYDFEENKIYQGDEKICRMFGNKLTRKGYEIIDLLHFTILNGQSLLIDSSSVQKPGRWIPIANRRRIYWANDLESSLKENNVRKSALMGGIFSVSPKTHGPQDCCQHLIELSDRLFEGDVVIVRDFKYAVQDLFNNWNMRRYFLLKNALIDFADGSNQKWEKAEKEFSKAIQPR